MASYTTYNFKMPANWQDYMPGYKTYSYSKPKETYSDYDSPYADDIRKIQVNLAALEKNKPGAYNSAYEKRINELINNLSNHKFNYDLSKDALYQQYRENYMAQGKQAMQDTIGQAAAMTGGYGNSYAAAAGNQAYQAWLGQLNNKIPELYQLAMQKHNMETSDMQNLYSVLSGQEATDYGRYRDRVSDYQNDRAYYNADLQNLRTMGQNLWGQQWDNYRWGEQQTAANRQNAIDTALNLYGNAWDNYRWAEQQNAANRAQAIAEDQWNAQFAENQRQYNQNMAYQKEQAAQAAKSAASGAGLTANYAKVRNSIVSDKEFYNSRRLSNNYQSYWAYIKSMIDGNKSLTDAERLQLISDFSKYYREG